MAIRFKDFQIKNQRFFHKQSNSESSELSDEATTLLSHKFTNEQRIVSKAPKSKKIQNKDLEIVCSD